MSRRALRIALLGINYAPEPTGIAPYTTGLAVAMARRGHDVGVLTGVPHYPRWRRESSAWSWRTSDDADGVTVRRLNHWIPRHQSLRGRLVMELTFGLQLLTCGWGRPDVVICISPPLVASALAAARARLTPRGPAVGILVHDLYGRGISETGAATGITARAVSAFESATLKMADEVAVIHDGFRTDLVEHLGIRPERVRELRNWTHIRPADPDESVAFRHRQRWATDEVVVLHAGNMGHKQGLENVIAAAAIAHRTGEPTRFVLLGDGNRRQELQAAAAGLPNLEFLAPVSDEDFPAALGAADVLLVNERQGVSQMAVPSKLTSYFRSGKPILAATDAAGFTARELSASGAGICVPADEPDQLVREAIRIAGDAALARRLGDAGRRYSDRLLSAADALDRYEDWIMDLAHESRRGWERSPDER